MASSLSNDFQCPHCGAGVHPNARSCKKCGAPAASPPPTWDHPEHLDGIDLPHDPNDDPDFDYSEFVESEFGDTGDRPIVIDLRKVIWWLTALGLFLVFLYWSTGGW